MTPDSNELLLAKLIDEAISNLLKKTPEDEVAIAALRQLASDYATGRAKLFPSSIAKGYVESFLVACEKGKPQ